MFKQQEMLAKLTPSNGTEKLCLLSKLIKVGLIALLVSGPIYATDPLEVDPDPDLTATTTIYTEDIHNVDTNNLPSGRYLIIVIVAGGPDEVYEILIP